ESVPVFTEPVELKCYTVSHYGLASGTHSETSASEPRVDSGYTLAEYLLVSVLTSIQSRRLVWSWFHSSTLLAAEHFTLNAESRTSTMTS
ncbi:unnamed protein product, partial [Porites evermanni]